MSTLVVIPFVDDIDMTIRCVGSVVPTLGKHDRVMLIANGSKGGNLDSLLMLYEGIEPILFYTIAKNTGIAGAWNMALDHFDKWEHDFVVFLHNDTTVRTNDWLTEMRLAFDVHKKAGAVFPRQVDTVGRFVEWDNGFPAGYCFMLNKKTVEKVGRFNTDFILKPDIEYFSRMREKEMNMVFIIAPCAVVEHQENGTSGKMYSLNYYIIQVQKEMGMLKSGR